ncbi:MAG: sulfotransferase domain-containing protein [Pseudomonadota bacterium]
MPKTLIWLASYPKSGNTWLRAFLANYFMQSDGPIPLDKIRHVSFGDSAAEPHLRGTPFNQYNLPSGQLLQLRNRWLLEISHRGAFNFVKTHNAHARLAQGWWIPAALTQTAIHIVRDPRDVLLSYADHWGIGLQDAASQMANPENKIPPNPKSVMQFLSSWSKHTESWMKTRDFRVLTVKYEDMLAEPEATFSKILEHIGAPLDQTVLRQAIDRASFRQLAADEAANGFSESGTKQKKFFRQGKAGCWHQSLPPDLADRIAANHRRVMKQLGYD